MPCLSRSGRRSVALSCAVLWVAGALPAQQPGRPAGAGGSSGPSAINPSQIPPLKPFVTEGLISPSTGDGPGDKSPAGMTSSSSTSPGELLHRYAEKLQDRGGTLRGAVFDDGVVDKDLPQFKDGNTSRVTVRSPGAQPSPSGHATLVALLLAGKDPKFLDLAGAAYNLPLYSYDYNDDLKNLEEVASSIQISNHSYVDTAGWIWASVPGLYGWSGDPRAVSDKRFGKYSQRNAWFDRILEKNPKLVAFTAAGNELGYVPLEQPKEHYYLVNDPQSNKKKWSPVIAPFPARRPDRTDSGGLDTIAGLGLSKNTICVGAVVRTNSYDERLVVAPFSSWGPTDDGRVKPDVVAVGTDIVHRQGPKIAGKREEGTSFATPIVAGIGALLVELYKNQDHNMDGHLPTSAEIKAVLIHTAIDHYPFGPDPKFGWGEIDPPTAGDIIAGSGPFGTNCLFVTGAVRQGETKKATDDKKVPYTFTRPESRVRHIRATLVWTDPEAPANELEINNTTSTLINDLDLELVAPDGTTFYPHQIRRNAPLAEASRAGPNHVDNVEVIDALQEEIEETDPDAGKWTFQVKGTRVVGGRPQKYALIVSSLPAPPSADARVNKQIARKKEAAARLDQTTQAPAAMSPASGGWRWLGPRDSGGPTGAAVIHPDQPGQIWAACLAGGVWYSQNAGATWAPAPSNELCASAVTSLVQNPDRPEVLFAGTGNVLEWGDYAKGPGRGIWSSADGGRIWAQLPATTGGDFRYINRLAISFDGDSLLAATTKGVFLSNDDGRSFTQTLPNVEVFDIEFHPTDSRICVAGGVKAAYFSNDGGKTWSKPMSFDGGSSFGLENWVELAYAKANPSIVYACRARNVFRSNDAGKSFDRVASLSEIDVSWSANVLWAGDPTNADILVAGSLWLSLSTDGGRTLSRLAADPLAPASGPGNPLTVMAHPAYNGGTNRTVYVGTRQGIYRIDDIGSEGSKAWKALNRGYGATQVLGVTGQPASRSIVAGTRYDGTIRLAGEDQPPTVWPISPGVGGFCVADPADPKILYAEYLSLRILRSLDGGATVAEIAQGIPDVDVRANMIAPFILDPNNASTMLAGGASLWRSTNIKVPVPVWSEIKVASGTNSSSYLSAIAMRQGAPSTIWVGQNDGRIFKTNDADKKPQPTWTQVGSDAPPWAQRRCTRIALDPARPQRVFLMFDGYLAGSVWRSDNDGATWNDVSRSLPAVPAYALVFHPEDHDRIYLGNDLGVFTSADGGDLWDLTNQGPLNIGVRDLAWMGKSLVAGTNGRGVFQIEAAELVRTGSP